jgi:DNA polymerase III alpha subunit
MTHSKTVLSTDMPTTAIRETDLVELLYQGKSGALTVEPSVLDSYIKGCQALDLDQLFEVQPMSSSIEDNVKEWNVPQHIKDLDLDVYFAERVSTVEEALRVAEELALYRSRGMEPMLRFMIQLVAIMREHKIVWGVGRGSSVSSYLLYLVGLHSINSVKYKLDIKEFIRDE